MSFIDFLWQGSPPPSVTSKTSSYEAMPDWFQAYQKGNLAKANAIAAEPYKTYTPPRIADFSADQQSAFSSVRNNQGIWQPALQQAQNITGNVARGFNPTEFSKWMSPYTDGVVKRIAELGARNMTENLLPGINDTFTGAGQFGSRRHGEFTNRALRDTNESILGQQSLALQQAHDSAMSNYQTGQNRQLAAGDQFSNIGSMLQQLGTTDAASLESIGLQQQQQNQKNLDLGYQDFVEQRDWPKSQVNWISNLLGNTAVGSSQTQTQTGPGSNFQPSGLSQLAGLYSLIKGLRKGGHVRKSTQAPSRRANDFRMPALRMMEAANA